MDQQVYTIQVLIARTCTDCHLKHRWALQTFLDICMKIAVESSALAMAGYLHSAGFVLQYQIYPVCL